MVKRIEDEIKIRVDKIIFNSKEDGFSVLRTKLLDSKNPSIIDEPIVVGKFLAINEGDELELIGSWGYDKKGRFQFTSDMYKTVMPATIKDTVEYLMRTAKGIGRKKATNIVDYFKEDTLNVIRENYTRLTEVEGIGDKTAYNIYVDVVGNKEFEELAMYLVPMGIKHADILTIYDELGSSALATVKANPYTMAKINKIQFSTLDRIAVKVGIEGNSEERLVAGVNNYISSSMNREGNLFVYKKDIEQNIERYLKWIGKDSFGTNYDISDKEIEHAIKRNEENKDIVIEEKEDGEECVYIAYYNHVENEIVTLINRKMDDFIPTPYKSDSIEFLIRTYEKNHDIKLAEKQKQAIDMALSNNISILSGGPGTGKTQTINAIINSIKMIDPEAGICLAAPTGKAANRMSEMTGMSAQTIHRLIGIASHKLMGDELVEVEAEYLIVDEASMIDAYLFYMLLTALSEGTKLLIVGDHEQLPSVGPGLILRDLMSSGRIPTVRLTEIFRQEEGSKIIYNSHRVIQGNKEELEFDSDSNGDFYFIDRGSVSGIRNGIMQSIENMMLNKGYNLDEIQVLSMMNKGPLGTVALNKEIQARFNPNPIAIKVGDRHFKLGDRVMQTVNNYDINIFNGDTGKIVQVDKGNNNDETTIYVDYFGEIVEYDSKIISELMLAYAITIHKSQGSEFPVVIMPFHKRLEILTNKNMINTGWTRAEQIVVCIGDKNELYNGIDRIGNTIRNSRIREKLSA